MNRAAGLLALALITATPLGAHPQAARSAQATPPPPNVQPLEQRLAMIAQFSAGEVGLAVVDVASGRAVSINGDERFPMASTVKVAIAATYLSEVDAGKRSLSTMIAFDEKRRLASEGIGQSLPHPGISLSAANYIELMLTVSDNSATDTLLAEMGGPAAVERWLTAHHVEGVRIDRNIGRLLLDDAGLPIGADGDPVAALRAADAMPMLTPAQLDAAARSFDADPRDTATPLGFARLLARIDKGELLSPASTKFLIAVLTRTTTGPDRIKGGLPADTVVAHKTGTLHGISDDIALVSLPDGRRIAIAAFTRGIADGKARAKIIADAARAIYDDALVH